MPQSTTTQSIKSATSTNSKAQLLPKKSSHPAATQHNIPNEQDIWGCDSEYRKNYPTKVLKFPKFVLIRVSLYMLLDECRFNHSDFR